MMSQLRERLGPWKIPLTMILVSAAIYVVWDEFFAPDTPTAPVTIQQQSASYGPVNPAAPEVLSADLAPVDLPIENIPQQTQVWCWAAVSQQLIAASRGMEQTPSQCQLVAAAYGADPGPCCAGQDSRCVTTGSLQQIQALIQQYGGRTSTYAEPTDAMTLYRTLKMGHAVVIGIDAGQGMGHVVVARGMSFQQTPQGVVAMVHINDPMAHFTQPVPYPQVAAVWRQAIIVN